MLLWRSRRERRGCACVLPVLLLIYILDSSTARPVDGRRVLPPTFVLLIMPCRETNSGSEMESARRLCPTVHLTAASKGWPRVDRRGFVSVASSEGVNSMAHDTLTHFCSIIVLFLSIYKSAHKLTLVITCNLWLYIYMIGMEKHYCFN